MGCLPRNNCCKPAYRPCSHRRCQFFSFIPNCQTLKDNVLVFPSLDCMYSFLKKPLDYYISDSNGIFNLDLYKISIGDDKKSEKVFWKNIEIISTETYNVNCKLTLFFVDNLGLEFKDKNRIEIMLNGSFILKIYNLFFKMFLLIII